MRRNYGYSVAVRLVGYVSRGPSSLIHTLRLGPSGTTMTMLCGGGFIFIKNNALGVVGVEGALARPLMNRSLNRRP